MRQAGSLDAALKLLVMPVGSSSLNPGPLHWECVESITTNKASEGDGIPVELFQILEDDAVKVLHPSGEPGVSGDFWGSQEGCQSKFAGILSAAVSQHHLLEFAIAQLEIHYLH